METSASPGKVLEKKPPSLLHFSLFVFHPYRNKIDLSGDFPGGPMVKNPPANAGDVGSIPGRGTRIPHAVGQPSSCATTTELVRLN